MYPSVGLHEDHAKLNYTDSAGTRAPIRGTSGAWKSEGEIRFFSIAVTGDLGHLGQNPAKGGGGWQVQNPATDAGLLPSTVIEPAWWKDNKQLATEPIATRSAWAKWNYVREGVPNGAEGEQSFGVSPRLPRDPREP